MTEPVLTIDDLHVDFNTPDGIVHAVRGVDLAVRPGETIGIVGESGSGKSVTMLAAMGLLPKSAQTSGSVRFEDQELLALKSRTLRDFRGAKLAIVFQDPMTSLNPVHRVGDQIAEAMRIHQEVSKREARERAVELLDVVGIPDARRRASQYPHEFSGGMRQRAMIAMAMVNNPDVLIADEPTTALDVTIQAQVLETLDKVRREIGSALVLITHDLGVIARMADRVEVMYAGKVVERGTVDEMFTSPKHPYTIGLLESIPRFDATEEALRPIPGAPPSPVYPPPGCAFHPRCPIASDFDGVCFRLQPELIALSPTHSSACHFAENLEARYEEVSARA